MLFCAKFSDGVDIVAVGGGNVVADIGVFGEDLFDKVNLQSECGINNDDYPDQQILEAALTGSRTLDDLMDEWNQKWSSAQETLGVEVTM